MPNNRLPLRLIIFAVLAIVAVVLIALAVSTLNSALELYERVSSMPLWLRLPLGLVLVLVVAALAVLAWRLWRTPASRQRNATRSAPSRDQVDEQLQQLRQRAVETSALQQELEELDRRRLSGDCHVAVFGEISTGKSSLIRALASQSAPDIDVLGGTTRLVQQFHGVLPDGRELILADVPGSSEVAGGSREILARDEALRAHAVLYVCASDLTRAQDAEITWLTGFGKPLILVLNKIDQLDAAQRQALQSKLQDRYSERVDAIVAVSSGGLERFERTLGDGRQERVERERTADVAPLLTALQRLTSTGVKALEPAREAAVLARLTQRGNELAREQAARASEAIVNRYTRRAVVGAVAAVAPGSDLIIQGALGTALIRALAQAHDVPVRELDVQALLSRLTLTVRNSSAIVLAIAGNALKAFPGLGTLGGGVMHAIAYGLVFDSVGHAVAATLAEHARLDQVEAENHIRQLLAAPARERIDRVARIAWEAVRERADPQADED